MKSAARIIAAAFLVTGGAALAEVEATNPTVIAWKQVMKQNGAAAKTLGDMAAGKAAFDAAAAGAARQKLIDDAAQIPVVFKDQAEDPASEAKPDIWANWDDFTAKAAALGKAAEALDSSSLDGLKAGMGDIGGACKACHSSYKM